MFRRRPNDDSDKSDDDTRDGIGSYDYDMSEPQAKRANNVWSDVLIEQTLEDKSNSVQIEKVSKSQTVSRGAETYHVPEGIIKTDNEKKSQKPIVAVTPATDDPFGDPVDLSAVEEFGVTGDGYRGHNKRGNRGRGRGWMRGRGRGQFHQNMANSNPHKRSWQPKQPLVNDEYSLQALMAAEFTTGLPIEQLGKEIALALGEKDPEAISKVVTTIGEEKALSIFDETRQVESSGGMKVMDGSRRRTPGGVYIMLVKSDMDISPEVKDKMFEQAKEDQRKIRKAKRSKASSYTNCLKEVEQLLEKEKNGDKILPDVKDVLKPAEPTSSSDASKAVSDEIDMNEMEN